MELADIQTCFTEGLKPACPQNTLLSAVDLIVQNKPIPAELALAIYSNNTFAARCNALRAAYPVCLRILGADCFNNIARNLIKKIPSKQADLNIEGETFCGFIEDWVKKQPAFFDFQYLGDLAQLEWDCHCAYYAADDVNFKYDFLNLAKISDPDTISFRLTHSVSLLKSKYPIMALRKANLSDDMALQVIASGSLEYLIVSRHAFEPVVTSVDKMTFNLMYDIQAGKSLSDIIGTDEAMAKKVLALFPDMIQLGWIAVNSGGR